MTNAARRTESQRPAILLADDERLITRVLTRMLDEAGFECVECHDGAVALQLVQQRHFDVVVSDVAMPMLTGLQFLEQVQRLELDLPVIIVSGDTSSEAALEALRLGAYEVLLKPIHFEQLLKAAREATLAGGARASDVEHRRSSVRVHVDAASKPNCAT